MDSDAAFLRLPQSLDGDCTEAWRQFVAAPPRSRELATTAFTAPRDAQANAWAGLCLAYHLARGAEVAAAESTLAEVRDLCAKLGDSRAAGLAVVLAAYVDIVRGKSDRAAADLERIAAAQATSEGAAPLDRFLVYHGLALAYARLGLIDRVLHNHYANVVMLERCGSPPPLAAVLLNLSSTLGAIDDWEEAFATATWAVRCTRALDNPVLLRRAEINVALTCRFTGRMDEALDVLARLRAEPMRDPGSDFALYINSAEALAVRGDLDAARECVARARTAAAAGDRHQGANCEWIAGLVAARSGDAPRAIAHLEAARAAVESLEQVHVPILPRIVEQLAQCYAQAGDHERAFATYQHFHEVFEARLGYTTRARSFGKQSRSGLLSIESLMRGRAEAEDEGAGLAEWARFNEAMRRALAKPAEATPPLWTAQAITRVGNEARGLGIDAKVVGDVIERLHRAPTAVHDAATPSIEVRVLGRFEARVDGEPLRFGRKAPARPLALLKCLAAQGDREAPETEIADALWPDQDGDVALRSLAVNLHRLRKLLGSAAAVAHHDHRIALDRRHVRCDAFEFEALLDGAAMAHGEAERADLAARALERYRGDFLADEDEHAWAFAVRERLRQRFLGACAAQGALLSAAGRMEEARRFYLRGLEIDGARDELCLGVMRCSLALREPAVGIAAYRALERALARHPGAAPAPAIRVLFGELLHQHP